MLEYGNFFVSIDKIKLKCRLKLRGGKPQKTQWRSFASVREWVRYISLHEAKKAFFEVVDEFENMALCKYRFMFVVRLRGEKEGSFTISEWYNGDYANAKENPYLVSIEYNPNKSGSAIYKEFCNSVLFDILEIQKFDLAYDIPEASAKDVFVNTRCDVMTYGKTNNSTTYIAPKEDRSGRVKIYDKKEERKAHGVELADTLRIEVTVKCKGLDFDTTHLDNATTTELSKVVDRLNSVNIKRKASGGEDWKIFALTCLTPEQLQQCLGFMASAQKAKYRKLIQDVTYYTLELDIATLVMQISTLLAPWKERVKVK